VGFVKILDKVTDDIRQDDSFVRGAIRSLEKPVDISTGFFVSANQGPCGEECGFSRSARHVS
jgi:hypothetical protein